MIHFGWVRMAFRCLGDRLALQLWATDCQQTEGLAVNRAAARIHICELQHWSGEREQLARLFPIDGFLMFFLDC